MQESPKTYLHLCFYTIRKRDRNRDSQRETEIERDRDRKRKREKEKEWGGKEKERKKINSENGIFWEVQTTIYIFNDTYFKLEKPQTLIIRLKSGTFRKMLKHL